MSKYTVLWTPEAEHELAALWLNTRYRDAVTRAANAVDSALSRNPLAEGESRAGDMRIMFEPPLALEFEVSESDRTVYVLAVWLYGKRSLDS